MSALATPPRSLQLDELRGLARELAERPELWVHLVKHEPHQRHYEELLDEQHVNAWLISWMSDHDTGFHDHDGSAGAVAVVGGRLREERLTLGGPPRERLFASGEVFGFAPSDIHRIRHAGGDPSVSIHVYSPPLASMGAYVLDDEGVLSRQPLSAAEELRVLHS